MDDILTIFPNNLDLKTGKTFIVGLTKVSKKKLVSIWKTSVVDIYEELIMNGDKEYFINKDYSEDLGEGGTDKMMNVIEDVRMHRIVFCKSITFRWFLDVQPENDSIILKIQKNRKEPINEINLKFNDDIDKIKNIVIDAFKTIH